MNRFLALGAMFLMTATLAACSHGGVIVAGGEVMDFDNAGLVLHASGRPDAHVSRDGGFSIGSHAVAVTPAQRQLLRRYYAEARVTVNASTVMEKQGFAMAADGIGSAIGSIFHGNASSTDKQMNALSRTIEREASAVCADVKALGATQNAIAAELPAFAPYGSSNRLTCEVTIGPGRSGAESRRFTYTLRKARSSHATPNHAPATVSTQIPAATSTQP
ncbi:MAG: hypothetical protein ACREP0_11015 [Rhodanobacteraceae bacterium]